MIGADKAGGASTTTSVGYSAEAGKRTGRLNQVSNIVERPEGRRESREHRPCPYIVAGYEGAVASQSAQGDHLSPPS